jgi:mannose-6-phosphate isomerase-like protein (cupin superfamily)
MKGIVTTTEIQNEHFHGFPQMDGLLNKEVFATGDQTTNFHAFGYKETFTERTFHADQEGVTHYIYVQEGRILVRDTQEWFPLETRMSMCCPGQCSIIGGGRGVVIRHIGHTSLFHITGALEKVGRLKYIDGASTTLLCPPAIEGDPCLNLLHFPPYHEQRLHNHPSFRFSIVARGSGRCIVPGVEVSIEAGDMFCIPTAGHHKIHTGENRMDIITFHPITTAGWTNEFHPMMASTTIIKEP